MDLNGITAIARPRRRAELPAWNAGDAWLAGGTWLLSEPQPKVSRLIDIADLGWPALEVTGQGLRIAATCKIAELEEALEGAEFFTPAHAALLQAMLARIDGLTAEIAKLTEVIEQLLAPYEEQLQQAESMPGWGRRSAQDAVAETGPDMTKFPTGGHLSSWAGRTPLDHQSGKRAGRARHKKGNKYLAAVTGETAVAAGKTAVL